MHFTCTGGGRLRFLSLARNIYTFKKCSKKKLGLPLNKTCSKCVMIK